MFTRAPTHLNPSPYHHPNNPNTPQTKQGLIGQEELALLPPDAVLVNVGRGNAVDEAALYSALRDGKVRVVCVFVHV